MNIQLTPDLEALVREGIAAGRFESAEAAVREALSLWQQVSVSRGYGPDYRALPSEKLEMLKRKQFTPEGRSARVAASLDALTAPQPTDLPAQQWKQIVEEIEDED